MGHLHRALCGALLACCAALMPAVPVSADQSYVYAPGGLALSGYDPVSYFSKDGPVPGRPEYALVWRGAVWYFASPESLMIFEMDPTAYAPQFGGYCAYAVARGRTATSEPDAYLIVDGRLYFMHTAEMVETYRPEMPDLIAAARSHWPAALAQD